MGFLERDFGGMRVIVAAENTFSMFGESNSLACSGKKTEKPRSIGAAEIVGCVIASCSDMHPDIRFKMSFPDPQDPVGARKERCEFCSRRGNGEGDVGVRMVPSQDAKCRQSKKDVANLLDLDGEDPMHRGGS